MEQSLSSATVNFFSIAMLMSFAGGYYLWQRHAGGRQLLKYEHREQVPWGPFAAVLGFFLPALFAVALLGEDVAEAGQMERENFIYLGWLQIFIKLFTVAAISMGLVLIYKATIRDLGLSTRIAGDFLIGAFTCIAALLPIYMVQFLLLYALDIQEQHPLIEQLGDSYDSQMIVVGIGLAVVVAPIYEEFVFRLLFQGWLEKLEDRIVRTQSPAIDSDLIEIVIPESQSISTEENKPLRGMFPNLPYGWAPILISGTLFGLAHLGHGVAPVAIALLGIILGYLYQRTHRILPCIAAHMVFNLFSMTLLVLELSAKPV